MTGRVGQKQEMKGMLCCIFNYAPLYRQAIYGEIDRAFDAQFCLADEPVHGKGDCGIAKMDTSRLRHPVIQIRNRMLLGRHPWRGGILRLALKRRFSTYLVTGDLNWAYIPFLLLCRMAGKRVYGWGHGLKSLDALGGLSRRFARWLYRSLDGYFIYGSRGRDRMGELGFDTSKIHVIYNSLVRSLNPGNGSAGSDANSTTESSHCENLGSCREENLRGDVFRNHFGNDDPTLVFSGRLTAAKRADLLVEAFLRLNGAGRVKCNLIIIGDGSELRKLKAMLAEAEGDSGADGKDFGEEIDFGKKSDGTAGSESDSESDSVSGRVSDSVSGRVWFYGECYDEARTAELLGSADLCVSPGNVGLMAIHAMQCGTPVVSHGNFETQMPEYEAIVQGKTGALFREGDIDDLCRVIEAWLTGHRGDRDLIRRNCREVISEHWTAETQIKTLAEVIKF